MRLKVLLMLTICSQFWNCKPEVQQLPPTQHSDKDLELYLQETFFFYELMRNQPSLMRDSIYKVVAVDLIAKYNLDSNRIHELTASMGPSTPAYSQMLDSIKTRLKALEMQ